MFGEAGKTTLVRKILWGVLPVVLIALLGVGVSNYLVAQRQIDKGIQKEVDSLAHQTAANLEYIFAQHQRDIKSLVESPVLVDYANNDAMGLDVEKETARKEIKDQFLSFSARNNTYSSVMFFDTKQKLVIGVEHLKPMEQAAFAALGFDKKPAKGVVQSPIRGPRDARLINYGCRIFDKEGNDCGVLVLTCDLTTVTKMLAGATVGENGAAFLADGAETPLLGNRPAARKVLARSVPIVDTQWHVVVQADAEEFLAPLRDLRDLVLVLICITIVMVPLVLMFVVRHATRPIKHLVAGTRKLAAGEMTYRFPSPNIRELSVLAESFNAMAEQIMNREEQLRSRIRQLTALRNMEATVIQRLNEETILRTCLDAVSSGLGFDRTGLYWVRPGENAIVGRYVHHTETDGLTEEKFQHHRVAIDSDDVLSQVVRSHEAMLVRHPETEAHLNQQFVEETKTREFIAAPICGKDHVFGVLAADNLKSGKPLEDSDREGLMLFAGAAGLALETAGLFDKLSISEARHRAVLDNSPVAILGLAQDHRINTWNRGAEAMFGYTAEEMIGKPISDLFPNSLDEFVKLEAEVDAKGAVREFPILSKNKNDQAMDLTISWGGSDTGESTNREWAVVIRDVTEAKKMQRHLIFSEKLSAVGQLIAGIAHELNNPLQAVVGYAEILNTQGATKGDTPKEIRYIFDNATRCRKIIDNLLLFVRSGEVKKATVKMQDVVRASMELLTHKVRKTAKLQVNLSMPDEPVYVKANFQQLEQVVVNIVNNACDAMETWEGERRLNLTVRAENGSMHMEMGDSGPGIPEHVCAKIFEPFFTTKPEGRGTGLGLPVCKQIVGEHGGELQVKTVVGKGTTFLFDLKTVEPEPVAPVPAEEKNGVAALEIPASRGGSLLLVEDEPAIRELLQQVLEDAGHRVDVSPSLTIAQEKAAKVWYDVIVTDVTLDDGTGIDLFKQWAKNSKQPRPPFLFLSGDILTGALGEAVCGDDVHLLQKPVDLKELRSTINTILTKVRSKAA